VIGLNYLYGNERCEELRGVNGLGGKTSTLLIYSTRNGEQKRGIYERRPGGIGLDCIAFLCEQRDVSQLSICFKFPHRIPWRF
jgi:hypothetical protein